MSGMPCFLETTIVFLLKYAVFVFPVEKQLVRKTDAIRFGYLSTSHARDGHPMSFASALGGASSAAVLRMAFSGRTLQG